MPEGDASTLAGDVRRGKGKANYAWLIFRVGGRRGSRRRLTGDGPQMAMMACTRPLRSTRRGTLVACGRRRPLCSTGADMNIFSCDPGLNGAGAVSDERGDFIACFDLPTIGEGAQRRVDAANLADLIREHGPYAFAIVEQVGARPGQGVRQCSGSGRPTGRYLA